MLESVTTTESLSDSLATTRRIIGGYRGDLLSECRRRPNDPQLPDEVRTAIFNAASSIENTMNLLAHAETLCENYDTVEVSRS